MKPFITTVLCALLWFAQPILAQKDRAPCYEHETVYLTGIMNIRESHTTSSKVLGQTKHGDSFEVTDTHDGDTYCWLEIGDRWIAVTSVLSSEFSDILPPISGGNRHLVRRLVRAYAFIRDKSDHYFEYVLPDIARIEIKSNFGPLAKIYVRKRLLEIADDHINDADIAEIASTLIHEACHQRRWDEGERTSIWDSLAIEEEKACYREQYRAILRIGGTAELRRHIECVSRTYPLTTFC